MQIKVPISDKYLTNSDNLFCDVGKVINSEVDENEKFWVTIEISPEKETEIKKMLFPEKVSAGCYLMGSDCTYCTRE